MSKFRRKRKNKHFDNRNLSATTDLVYNTKSMSATYLLKKMKFGNISIYLLWFRKLN